MWVYRLFYWLWTPILKDRPDLVKLILSTNLEWLANREKLVQERRATFKVVKNNEDNGSK